MPDGIRYQSGSVVAGVKKQWLAKWQRRRLAERDLQQAAAFALMAGLADERAVAGFVLAHAIRTAIVHAVIGVTLSGYVFDMRLRH